MQNIIPAFSALLQEAFTAIAARDNSRLEHYLAIDPIDDSQFQVRFTVVDRSIDPGLCELRSRPHIPELLTSKFIVRLIYSGGLNKVTLPWETLYLNRPHIIASILISALSSNYFIPSPRLTGDLYACQRITGLIEDPECHTKLADKIYTAIGIYVLTGKKLPDH